MNKTKIIRLIISLAIPLLVGGIAGYLTAGGDSEWYNSLNSPSFSPPDYVFGPVWTTLYALMGISLYLIWNSAHGKILTYAFTIFFIQLALNFLWSFLFFSYHQLTISFIEIIVLWIAIIFMMIKFYKINPWAAYINIPYLLWVTFAAVLNGAYLFLN